MRRDAAPLGSTGVSWGCSLGSAWCRPPRAWRSRPRSDIRRSGACASAALWPGLSRSSVVVSAIVPSLDDRAQLPPGARAGVRAGHAHDGRRACPRRARHRRLGLTWVYAIDAISRAATVIAVLRGSSAAPARGGATRGGSATRSSEGLPSASDLAAMTFGMLGVYHAGRPGAGALCSATARRRNLSRDHGRLASAHARLGGLVSWAVVMWGTSSCGVRQSRAPGSRARGSRQACLPLAGAPDSVSAVNENRVRAAATPPGRWYSRGGGCSASTATGK